MSKKRRDLTPAEIRAADKLKAEFKSRKKELGLTYEEAASKLGWTPSNLSHYLNKNIPINMEALIKICSLMPGVNAKHIYPELFTHHDLSIMSDPDDILESFYSLDKAMQDAIKLMIISNRNDSPAKK